MEVGYRGQWVQDTGCGGRIPGSMGSGYGVWR